MTGLRCIANFAVVAGSTPPAGRDGPRKTQRVVHFLAADASSYFTGQVWSVNGGMDM